MPRDVRPVRTICAYRLSEDDRIEQALDRSRSWLSSSRMLPPDVRLRRAPPEGSPCRPEMTAIVPPKAPGAQCVQTWPRAEGRTDRELVHTDPIPQRALRRLALHRIGAAPVSLARSSVACRLVSPEEKSQPRPRTSFRRLPKISVAAHGGVHPT